MSLFFRILIFAGLAIPMHASMQQQALHMTTTPKIMGSMSRRSLIHAVSSIGTFVRNNTSGFIDPSSFVYPSQVSIRDCQDNQRWQKGMMALLHLRMCHGHCIEERNRIGSWLRRWISTQRIQYKRGVLLPNRRQRLINMGFLWDKHFMEWEKKFAELQEYRNKFGHCNVPYNCRQERTLGAWVFNQRVLRRAGKLSIDRQNKLVEVGFMWELQGKNTSEWQARNKEVEWRARFVELLRFKLIHGHTVVKKREGALGKWVTILRSKCKVGKMQADRLAMLRSINFELGKSYVKTSKIKKQRKKRKPPWNGDGSSNWEVAHAQTIGRLVLASDTVDAHATRQSVQE